MKTKTLSLLVAVVVAASAALGAAQPKGAPSAEQLMKQKKAELRQEYKKAAEMIRKTGTLVYAHDDEAKDEVVAAFDDGSMIVLSDTPGKDSRIVRIGTDKKVTVLLDGGKELQRIAHEGKMGQLSAPDFDHASRTLVYSVRGVNGGGTATFVYDLNSRETKEIFRYKSGQQKLWFFYNASAIAPGGKAVAGWGMQRQDPKTLRFLLGFLDVETNAMKEVVLPQGWGRQMGQMCWGPEGKELYVGITAQQEAKIVRYSMDSGELETVYLQAMTPSVSADGKKLAFVQMGELYVMDFSAERGGARRVAEGMINNIKWNPSGDKLYVTAVADEEGRTRVFRIDLPAEESGR